MSKPTTQAFLVLLGSLLSIAANAADIQFELLLEEQNGNEHRDPTAVWCSTYVHGGCSVAVIYEVTADDEKQLQVQAIYGPEGKNTVALGGASPGSGELVYSADGRYGGVGTLHEFALVNKGGHVVAESDALEVVDTSAPPINPEILVSEDQSGSFQVEVRWEGRSTTYFELQARYGEAASWAPLNTGGFSTALVTRVNILQANSAASSIHHTSGQSDDFHYFRARGCNASECTSWTESGPQLLSDSEVDIGRALTGGSQIADCSFFDADHLPLSSDDPVTSVHTILCDASLGLASIQGIMNFTHVHTVDISGNPVSDVSDIVHLSYLRDLDLSATAVDDEGVAVLHSLVTKYGFTEMNLSDTQVSDLSFLSEAPDDTLRLQSLSINRTPVSDLSVLHSLPELSKIELDDTLVSDYPTPAGPFSGLPEDVSLVGSLVTDFPLATYQGGGVERLRVGRAPQGTDYGQIGLANFGPELIVVESGQADLDYLLPGGRLKHLDVTDSISNIDGLVGQPLNTLIIRGGEFSDASTLRAIESMSSLNHLELPDTSVPGAESIIEWLGQITASWVYLDLTSTKGIACRDEAQISALASSIGGESTYYPPLRCTTDIRLFIANVEAEESDYIQFMASASGGNEEDYVFSADNLPGWLTLNPITGDVAGLVPSGSVGSAFTTTISVSDGVETVSRSFTITIVPDTGDGLQSVTDLGFEWISEVHGRFVLRWSYPQSDFQTASGKPDFFRIKPLLTQNGGATIPNDLAVIQAPQFQDVWESNCVGQSCLRNFDYTGSAYLVYACRLVQSTEECGSPAQIHLTTDQTTDLPIPFNVSTSDSSPDVGREFHIAWETASDSRVDYFRVRSNGRLLYTEQPKLSVRRSLPGIHRFVIDACQRIRGELDSNGDQVPDLCSPVPAGGNVNQVSVTIHASGLQPPGFSAACSAHIDEETTAVGVSYPEQSFRNNAAPDYFQFKWSNVTNWSGVGTSLVTTDSYSPEGWISGPLAFADSTGQHDISFRACKYQGEQYCSTPQTFALDDLDDCPESDSPGRSDQSGGPADLIPGDWWDPNRAGTGWSFFWASKFRYPSIHEEYGNTYDLIAFWYTYRRIEGYWQPYWYFAQLKQEAGVFKGAIYQPRFGHPDGHLNVGTLTVQFDGTDSPYLVPVSVDLSDVGGMFMQSHTLDLQHFTNNEDFLGDGDATNGICGDIWEQQDDNPYDHKSGFYWHSQNGSLDESFATLHWVSRNFESFIVPFYDAVGRPIWARADWMTNDANSDDDPDNDQQLSQGCYSPIPSSGPETFDFNIVSQGFDPTYPRPQEFDLSESLVRVGTGVRSFDTQSFLTAVASLDLNYSMEFSPSHTRIASLTKSNLTLTKVANQHDIRVFIGDQDDSDDACTTTWNPDVHNNASWCGDLRFRWFTDMYYPETRAVIVAADGATQSIDQICNSAQPVGQFVVEDHPCDLSLANNGAYSFALQKAHDAAQQPEWISIAQSTPLTVVDELPPNVPHSLARRWVVRDTGFDLIWEIDTQCADGSLVCGADYFEIRQVDPAGQVSYSQTSAPLREYRFPDANDYGNYDFAVRACGPLICSAWTDTLAVYVHETEVDPVPAPHIEPIPGLDVSSSTVGSTPGEFDVDEAGNYHYRIPLLTAPGSGGVAPDLSLVYTNASSNGVAGLGWSIGGASSVTRCGQTIEVDGPDAVTGVHMQPTDRFCLDGARLILLDPGGVYGGAGTEYRTQIDSIARIIANGNTHGAPTSFTVYRKDGTVSEYGGSTDSRFALGGEPAYAWGVNRIADSAGNYMVFEYESVNSTLETLLRRVRYTGNAAAGIAPYNVVEFIYESDRPDQFTTYVAGHAIPTTQRLAAVHSQAVVELDQSLQTVRYYDLDYVPGGIMDRSALASVAECYSVDESESTCFPPTGFDWLDHDGRFSATPQTISANVGLPDNLYIHRLVPIDVNADGRQDVVYSYGDIDDTPQNDTHHLQIRITQPPGSPSSFALMDSIVLPESAESTNELGMVSSSWRVMDVNGDGLQEIIYPAGSSWMVRLSDGQNLATPTAIGNRTNAGTTIEPRETTAMDFSGDGRVDLVFGDANGDGLFVSINESHGDTIHFSDPIRIDLETGGGTPTTDPAVLTNWPGLSDGVYQSPDGGVIMLATINPNQIVDFDGDGAVDVVIEVAMDVCHVASCQPSESIQNPQLTYQYLSEEAATEQSTGGAIQRYSAWYVAYSESLPDGSHALVFDFQSPILWSSRCELDQNDACNPILYPKSGSVRSMDLNGDGLAEVTFLDQSFGANHYWKFFQNTGGAVASDPNLATTVYPIDLRDDYQTQFMDVTGDGLVDFLYTVGDQPGDRWHLVRNGPGGFSAQPVPLTAIAGDMEDEGDQSLFIDINGDGNVDQLYVNRGSDFKVDNETVREGISSAVGAPWRARGVVESITSGLGAQTRIEFKALTQPSVYQKFANAHHLDYGAGSAVYDIIAPTYVVAAVHSSSPAVSIEDDPIDNGLKEGPSSNDSSVFYFYKGARIQGGGRGFLGFEEVATYDPQTRIRTTTRYRQDYPFVGSPVETVTELLAHDSDRWNLTDSVPPVVPCQAACSARALPAVPTQTPPATFPSIPSAGTRIGWAINEYAEVLHHRNTASAPVTYPYLADSYEASYELNGAFTHAVETSLSYSSDSYANLLLSTVTTTGIQEDPLNANLVEPVVLEIKTTDNSAPGDYQNFPAQWHLGRLVHSRAVTQRGGGSSVVHTEYAYDSTTGILKRESLAPGTQDERITAYDLDAFGNRRVATVSGFGVGSARSTRTEFDALGRYVIEEYNTDNDRIRLVVQSDVFGNPLTVENALGRRQINRFDAMGRPYFTRLPTGAWSKTTNEWTTSGCASGAIYKQVVVGGGVPEKFTCFDVIGREIQVSTAHFSSGSWISVVKRFDPSGRVTKVSEPEPGFWTLMQYDAIGRPVKIEHPDHQSDLGAGPVDSVTHMLYGFDAATGFWTRTTNSLSQDHLEIKNAMGEIVEVHDAAGGVSRYGYDVRGNLESADGPLQGSQDVMRNTFDVHGHKTRMTDPDKGEWLYDYNALGELICQIDARNHATYNAYDALGRLVTRTLRWEPARDLQRCGTGEVLDRTEWTFGLDTSANDFGQVRSESTHDGIVKDYRYDNQGRMIEVTTTIDGAAYVESTTYDEYGRVFQTFNSLGENSGTRYEYNDQGYLYITRSARFPEDKFEVVTSMNRRGEVSSVLYGNDTRTTRTYVPSNGRLQHILTQRTHGPTHIIQDLTYVFDPMGSLKSRATIREFGDGEREEFTYDSLNRLRIVNRFETDLQGGSQLIETRETEYDAAGRIIRKDGVGTYIYSHSSVHGVDEIEGGAVYTYDANGNMVADTTGRSIVYSAFDKPTTITASQGQQTRFVYGPQRQMVKREDFANATQRIRTTRYLGSVEIIANGLDEITTFKRYTGSVVQTIDAQTGSVEIQYLHRDHLGSVDAISDATGRLETAMSFDAWGQRRGATNWSSDLDLSQAQALADITTEGFTGHQQIDTAGIIHMKGRIYDPILGRFLQADPIVQEPFNPQNLDRYTYVLNNPLSFTDPTGYSFFSKYWRTIASLAINIWLPGAGFWSTLGVSKIGIATATGFISGAVSSGSVKGAILGAFSARLFFKIGDFFGPPAKGTGFLKSGYSGEVFAAKVGAHAIAGGVMSELQGGKFGHGFASAGLTQAFSPLIGTLGAENRPSPTRILAASLIGGTASKISGGKFANGAVTAAFSRAFNHEAHLGEDVEYLSKSYNSETGLFQARVMDSVWIPEPGWAVKESPIGQVQWETASDLKDAANALIKLGVQLSRVKWLKALGVDVQIGTQRFNLEYSHVMHRREVFFEVKDLRTTHFTVINSEPTGYRRFQPVKGGGQVSRVVDWRVCISICEK